MKKIGIFYGSTTGTTESVAKQIASELSIAAVDVYDVAKANVDSVQTYEILLLGASTWGFGELQDDWYGFLEKLKATNLSGKQVAIFGCGDSSSYDTTFCDSIGIIYEELLGSGCTFIGSCDTTGYSYSGSKAEVDGKFIGLPIDDVNESNLTEERIQNWIKEIKNA